MANDYKRVAVIEDLDSLLACFHGQESALGSIAVDAARTYAETNVEAWRHKYLAAADGEKTVAYLRQTLTQYVRVLLPGEVDRLHNKG